jgi:hypothetical protein
MGNALFEQIYVMSSVQTKQSVCHVKNIINKGLLENNSNIHDKAKLLLDYVPKEMNFYVSINNDKMFAISKINTQEYGGENVLTLSQLMEVTGLNNEHKIKLDYEQAYLISYIIFILG